MCAVLNHLCSVIIGNEQIMAIVDIFCSQHEKELVSQSLLVFLYKSQHKTHIAAAKSTIPTPAYPPNTHLYKESPAKKTASMSGLIIRIVLQDFFLLHMG